MYIRDFVVEGTGPFPIDMLRYDACYPARQEDVENMLFEESKRVVTLRRPTSQKRGGWPTVARWESFGWTVVQQSHDPMKVSLT